jgi:hypothetical protein
MNSLVGVAEAVAVDAVAEVLVVTMDQVAMAGGGASRMPHPSGTMEVIEAGVVPSVTTQLMVRRHFMAAAEEGAMGRTEEGMVESAEDMVERAEGMMEGAEGMVEGAEGMSRERADMGRNEGDSDPNEHHTVRAGETMLGAEEGMGPGVVATVVLIVLSTILAEVLPRGLGAANSLLNMRRDRVLIGHQAAMESIRTTMRVPVLTVALGIARV